MKTKPLHFELKRRAGSFRLKPDSAAAVKRLSFKEGSAIFVGLFKSTTRALRKQGFVPDPKNATSPLPLDPFAILTGKKPLPLGLVSPGKGRAREIDLPPFCVVCIGDGGCTGHFWRTP
jgi:hypothetical protein